MSVDIVGIFVADGDGITVTEPRAEGGKGHAFLCLQSMTESLQSVHANPAGEVRKVGHLLSRCVAKFLHCHDDNVAWAGSESFVLAFKPTRLHKVLLGCIWPISLDLPISIAGVAGGLSPLLRNVVRAGDKRRTTLLEVLGLPEPVLSGAQDGSQVHDGLTPAATISVDC